MKPEQLSDALNYLDDELLQEEQEARLQTAMPQQLPGQPDAQPARQQTGQPAPGDAASPAPKLTARSRGKKTVWMRRAAAAACLALCLGGGVWLWQRGGWGQPLPIDPAPGPDASQPGWTPAPNLPLLTIDDDLSGGMGFEGYMAYDISELVSANPWTEEAGITALPVYRNTLKSGAGEAIPSGQAYPITEEQFARMRAFLLEVAGRLGLDTETLAITDNAPSEEYKAAIREKYADIGEEAPPEEFFAPTMLIAEQNGIRLEIEPSMTVAIWYNTPVSLPEGYRFGYYNMSYEQAQASAGYLLQEYQGLIAMQEPQTNVFMGDYNIYAQQSYSVSFFEGAGSLTEQIVNYNFNQIQFYTGEENAFDLVRVFAPDLSNKMGDYPIITAGEARELLLQGHYITTVPYEMPGEEWIRKAELVYRSGMYDEFFMPYYRFYIELPEQKRENGLNIYGAFYVPAVEGQYLTNMPVWDGSFN